MVLLMVEVSILILEALEAVYVAVQSIYERVVMTDDEEEYEHQFRCR
jgi:hypothetical protein